MSYNEREVVMAERREPSRKRRRTNDGGVVAGFRASGGRLRHVSMRKVIPDMQLVRMRWSENVSLDPAVNATATVLFSANSIYDPLPATANTRAPHGYDQYEQWYKRYMVTKAVIRIDAFPDGGAKNTGRGLIFSYQCPRGETALPSADVSQVRTLDGVSFLYFNNDKGHVVHRRTWNGEEHFDGRLNENVHGGAFGSAPSIEANYIFGVCPVNGSDNVGAVHCCITVDFHVLMFHSDTLAQSAVDTGA
jgi:hypothetical protein